MSKVSLSTLAAKLSEKSGLSTTEAELFIRKMFDVCHQGLEADKQVKMRWLGTFKVTSVKDRESVDVNTGERIMIEGRDKISFTPDNILKEIVNKPFAQFETVVVNDGVDFEEIDKKFEAENEDRDKIINTEFEDSELTEQAQMNTAHEVAEEKVTANESPVETSNESPVETSEEPSVESPAESPIINGVIDFLNTPETAKPTSDVIIIGEDVALQNEAESPASTSVEEVGVVTNAFHQEVEDTTSSFAPDYLEAETINQETNRVKATEKVEVNVKDTEKEEANTDANDKVEAGAESSNENEITAETENEIAAEAETEIATEAEAELRRRHYILPKWAVAVASIVVLALIAGMGWLAFNYGQIVAQRDNLAMKLDQFKAKNVAPKPQPKSQEEILREKAREDSIRMLQASEALKAAEQAEKDSIAKSKEELSAKELLAKEQMAKEQLAKEKLTKEKLTKEKLTKEKLAKEKLAQEKQAQEKQAKEKLEKEKQAKAKLAAEAKASSTKVGNANKYDHDARVRTGAYRIVGVAQTVTVGEGQSLAAISKRYLGPGMECYIEAINGTSSVKSGQKIKIPKLELKKKNK